MRPVPPGRCWCHIEDRSVAFGGPVPPVGPGDTSSSFALWYKKRRLYVLAVHSQSIAELLVLQLLIPGTEEHKKITTARVRY